MKMIKTNLQVIDIMIAERSKLSREARKVDGIIAMLRKIADDLEADRAIELDYTIDIEELNNFDEIYLRVKTYHLKQSDGVKKLEVV